jgi:hypothetical protein
MLNFFTNNYLTIISCILALLYGYTLYSKYKGKPKAEVIEGLEKDAFDLMQLAERYLPNEKGYVKFNWVAERFRYFIPEVAKPFFKQQTVEHFLQQTYYKVKDKLDDGKVNKSIPYPDVNDNVTTIADTDAQEEDTEEPTQQPEPITPLTIQPYPPGDSPYVTDYYKECAENGITYVPEADPAYKSLVDEDDNELGTGNTGPQTA